jgi:uncharacterized protein (TIGR02231 family)
MDPLAVAAAVVEVTLLEDRAFVRRQGRVDLPAGTLVVTVEGVAPALVDKTLTAAVEGPAPVSVAELRVLRRRRVLAGDRPAAVSGLEAELTRLERERLAVGASGEHVRQALALARQARALLVSELGEDAAWGQAAPQRWRADLAALDLREDGLDAEALALDQRRAELDERIADLEARLAPVEETAGLAAAIQCRLVVAQAGEYSLTLGYLVPGAAWRPYHTARLLQDGDGPARVEVTCEACVWQSTGEDWTGVALACSTERPSLGVEPPVLEPDVLRLQRKEPATVIEEREQVVETTGPSSGPAAAELPGIDDGGEARLLRAGPADVPSDGQPHRLPLFSFAAAAEPSLVLAGELVPAVVRATTQTNPGPAPLLAGPVDLIRRNGPAGRTSILFVAPGARFELGWGPEGDLRVDRSVAEKEEKEGLLSGWRARRYQIDVTISNLGPEPHTIAAVERIPVSEIDKVEVALDGKPDPLAQPDGDGLLHWILTVPGRRQQRLRLAYRVRRHPDVVGG